MQGCAQPFCQDRAGLESEPVRVRIEGSLDDIFIARRIWKSRSKGSRITRAESTDNGRPTGLYNRAIK